METKQSKKNWKIINQTFLTFLGPENIAVQLSISLLANSNGLGKIFARPNSTFC